MYSMKL